MIIDGGGLRAVVDAHRGAKITSLLDARGVEWLAQAPPATAVEPGLPFTDAEMAGWDECAPSIVECTVDGRHVPDHGDLWDRPFTVSGSTTTAEGGAFDYIFERRIDPTVQGLRLVYTVTARSTPVPFLWAAHPQFLAPAGTRVELSGVTEVVDVMADPVGLVEWSPEMATIDDVEPGGCRKVYLPPEHRVPSAALERADGSRLELAWSSACSYLGIWFDNRAYSREAVIALEPSTGYFDSLTTAIALGRVPLVQPGRPLTWSLDVRIDLSAERG